MSSATSDETKAEEQFLPAEVKPEERKKVFQAVEYQPVEIPLDELIVDGRLSVYPAIAGQDFFKFHVKKDKLVFTAGGYIGLIPINDNVVLDIRTRVPVKNLERILLIAEHSPKILKLFSRDYFSYEQTFPSLIEILAETLVEALQDVEQHGLYREYVYFEKNTSFPRGKILLGKTLQTHLARGRTHAVTASWYEPSVDIPVNRCLKYAIWLLAQKYRLMPPKKGRRGMMSKLNHLYQLFEKVALDLSRSFLNDRLIIDPDLMPSIRDYYNAPLRVAKTIIEERGIALDRAGDDILLPSLVLRLEEVFEKYARAVLREKMADLQTEIQVLDGNQQGIGGGGKLLFDPPAKDKANPDIVFKYEASSETTFPLIIDVKYKDIDRPEREDLYQIISYGYSYRAPSVLILHPKRETSVGGLNLMGTIGKFSVYNYAFDLASHNPAGEEDKFFREILALLPQTKKPAEIH